MNKLEVGMYVRTKSGKIGIVQNFNFVNKEDEERIVMVQFQDDFTPSIVDKVRISKASHNIIDLIEVGDVIKFEYDGTEYICDVYECYGRKDDLGVCCETNIIHIKEDNDRFELKSIVTKEQFSSMEYRLGG